MKPIEEFLKKKYGAIHDGITEGKHPGGTRRYILAEVSVKYSEGIVGGVLEEFFGTNPETFNIETLQDAYMVEFTKEYLL